MLKLLFVAFVVGLAVAQTPAAPTGASQTYVLATTSFSNSSTCSLGTNYQNVYSASVAFFDSVGLYQTKVPLITGTCTNTTSVSATGSVKYNYLNGTLQRWSYTTANCSGNATATNLTTSCTDNSAANGYPSSTQTIAILYVTGTTFPGYATTMLNAGNPASSTFVAAGVCLRVPPSSYTKWNSTKYTCTSNTAGSSPTATQALFSDNNCNTPYVAPPAAPVPVTTYPPYVLPPNAITYLYTCSNSGPAVPVTPPANPTSPGSPGSGGNPSPSGSPSPKAPSSASTVVLSAAALVAAVSVLLL